MECDSNKALLCAVVSMCVCVLVYESHFRLV